MEKRILLALAFSFIVIFVYSLVFTPQPVKKQEMERTNIPVSREKVKIETPRIPEIEFPSEAKDKEEKTIKVETPLFRVLFSNRGGVLKSWVLKKYKDEKGKELELVNDPSSKGHLPLSLKVEKSLEFINDSLFIPSKIEINLKENGKEELILTFSEGDLKVIKRFTFTGNSYLFDFQTIIYNKGEVLIPEIYIGPRVGRFTKEEMKVRMDKFNIVYWNGTNIIRKEDKKFNDGEIYKGFLKWCAFETNYFVIIAIPNSNSKIYFEKLPLEKGEPLHYLAVSNPKAFYIGPKEFGTLKKLLIEKEKINLEKVVNFGWFGFIAQLFLIILNWLYRIIPNYGIAIILLTIILKIALFPLSWTSMVSMAKMQKIQPKIKALREKYKKMKTDPELRKKFNMELMQIYKEEGINPAEGCFPLLLQLPILWGFFNLLSRAVEIRHKPFILWIKDLSLKDPFYVLPILMGITQFIIQKMTPSGGDPTQKKMMLIMPVFLTIFFMNFPSGLVLYWLVQNIIQIGQQHLMNKYIYKPEKKNGKRIQRKKS
ncbi:MAG: membrane protein insertase YidC [Candidatus Aminicenantia bacterium]